jgi:hypothetical protein
LDGETDMESEYFEYIAYDRYAHVYEIPQAEGGHTCLGE